MPLEAISALPMWPSFSRPSVANDRSTRSNSPSRVRQRPPVTAYVTREHPVTGADELLVFDVPGIPEYTAVVPGGGIEEGETIAETAVREVKEETGIDVVFVRELGSAEDPVGHYVQVTPTSRLPETWEHDGRACRWVPVWADLELWGLRGDYVHALVRKRVVGYVTRGRELLVFDHKGMQDVPTQVPAGRVDSHESLEEGLVREVAEETGVSVTVVRELADEEEFERLFGPGAHKSHAFHAQADLGGPDEWEHPVSGTGMDAGLVYACRWVSLDDPPLLWGTMDPLVEKLRASITDE
jgi:ADP-ribose pyrophosphatase YjhB (NUDIX family)